ncbi:4-hydroxybenzoate octaprenyltransferase [Pelagibius sp. CAU 1746]|uniref:4-hydroxybenzoate octaprenyltransferase n=1 Tax=Pelagibius sp. CAU 1746 TaxID=3140370 RepID=UPI00325ADFC0
MNHPSSSSRAPSSQGASASDIRADAWVLRLAPAGARPYLRLARLDRPIGTWLLLFPGWWAIALGDAYGGDAAANGGPSWWLYLYFGLGAVLMRSAGCVVNDILDRDIDGKVARTAARPIPAGEVSLTQAGLFLLVLLLASFAILVQMNTLTVAMGCASLLLVFPYPLMKRITYWPQAWLGLTFNWGALIGWTAATGTLAWPPLLLYLAGIAWTLGYDTIYGHQDKEDDLLVGVKSLALRLDAFGKPWFALIYSVTVALFGAAGWATGLLWPFWIGLAAVAAQFAWQVRDVDLDDPANCRAKFKSNRFVGWLLLAGILGGSPWVHDWIRGLAG